MSLGEGLSGQSTGETSKSKGWGVANSHRLGPGESELGENGLGSRGWWWMSGDAVKRGDGQ